MLSQWKSKEGKLRPLTLVLVAVIVVVAVVDIVIDIVIPPAPDFRLTIVHNNSPESHLLSLGPGLEDFGSAALFASTVERERKIAASFETDEVNNGLIMVSSGNNFLAGKEFVAGHLLGTYFDAWAIDLIDYDAIALGAHDFDFFPEVLAEFIKQVSASQVRFISSNLDFSGEPALRELVDDGRIAESVVVEKNGERIGIVGAITPELNIVSSPRNVKIMSHVAEEVQAEVDRLEASGINKIVLVSHLQNVEADIALLGQIHGVDVVVAGGSDVLLANEGDPLIPGDDEVFGPYPIMATDRDGHNVPVVSTKGRYSYLGKLVITFDSEGRRVAIDEEASGPIRIARSDTPMEGQVIGSLIQAIEKLKDPIGDTDVALDGRGIKVRFEETNLGNLMADALLWQATRLAIDNGAALPDVAIQNSGGIRNDRILPPGVIRLLDTFDMAPYVNAVTLVEGVSRNQFKEVLENAVSRAVNGDNEVGTGRFAQISGFRFEWSESGTAQVLNPDGSVKVPGTRVQKVVLTGGDVVVDRGIVMPGRDLNVATPDFTARGGDEYPFRGASFTRLGPSYQLGLANYIESTEGLDKLVTAADYPAGGEGRIRRLP